MIVLQYSGGKDSLACLYLLKHRWDELTVCWVNTGAAFPETIEHMERIRALVPHFHEVKSEQTITQGGYPVDVLPISRSTFGQMMTQSHGPRFQSRYVCCGSALWFPLDRAMREMGAKVVIRGQKNSDRLQAPLQHGSIQDGIQYEFPLRDWTDEDVYRYLAKQNVELPVNYRYMDTGLDCWNCTAYLDENRGKFRYMREHHPEKYRFMRDRLEELHSALRQDSQPLTDILQVTS